jgi:transcription elongation factor Elf1
MKTRSLKLTCPLCGATDAITVNLNNLDDVTCEACGETRTPQVFRAAANELLAKWQRLCLWLDSAPIAK